MDTHIQGPFSFSNGYQSEGALVSQRMLKITYANNATPLYLGTVEADTHLPVFLEFTGYVETVFNGVGVNTLGIGSTAGASNLVPTNVFSLTGGVGTQSGDPVILRARTKLYASLTTGTKATGTFTPPTSSTATAVINGVSFLATFNSSATQTVTDLKALIAANSTISALITTSGTTTLVVTAKAAGTAGNAITTTSDNAHGASWAAATLTGGLNATAGSMLIILRATGPGKGLKIAN